MYEEPSAVVVEGPRLWRLDDQRSPVAIFLGLPLEKALSGKLESETIVLASRGSALPFVMVVQPRNIPCPSSRPVPNYN